MPDPADIPRRPPRRERFLLGLLLPDQTPLALQILGKTLLHAAFVGVLAGLVGAAFFAALEYAQLFVLEDLAGYLPLRAQGEQFVHSHGVHAFRPWMLVLLPALGGLVSGILSRLAPETRGGGGDAMIDAFHRAGGFIRRRVIAVKALASLATLGTGGAGGREGPTMLIGGGLGSLVASVLRASARERRILMVAGVAAGMAAVFRTPLGAALLAIEVLYRDDFEAEALVPAVLASVVAYSVVILIFGESTLFGRGPRYPFVPAHLPLYALLALLIAVLAIVFLAVLRGVQRLSGRLPVAPWARPALGGLALGLFAVPVILYVGWRLGTPGQGLGILGGGYGAAQTSMTGADWLPGGWRGAELLLLLCLAKVVASSLTIGSGGSAGDFAPSLVIGGLFGGAFGRVAQVILQDPRIDPGAFALVGMGTFYGSVAHVPISSLVMVCELAGNYDLLVPLMLAEGIASVVLWRRSLYHAQVPTRRESAAHGLPADVLARILVGDVLTRGRAFVTFSLSTPTPEVKHRLAETSWQDVFPVLDAQGGLRGIITADMVRTVAHSADADWTIAADIMQPPVVVAEADNLRMASDVLHRSSLREVPVTAAQGHIVGFLDEADIAKAYLEATAPTS